MTLIEARATRPVSEIRDDVVAAVRAWSSDLDDDMSILIARFREMQGSSLASRA